MHRFNFDTLHCIVVICVLQVGIMRQFNTLHRWDRCDRIPCCDHHALKINLSVDYTPFLFSMGVRYLNNSIGVVICSCSTK
jgi:hypothetical protein